MVKCSKCGENMQDDLIFCPKCGYSNFSSPFYSTASVEKKKYSKAILLPAFAVLILVLFLGIQKYLHEIDFINNIDAQGKAAHSVVTICCYDNYGNLINTGNGFIAFDDGAIVTSNHLIRSAYTIKAVTNENKKFRVDRILAYDEDTGIAILSTATKMNISALRCGSSSNLEKFKDVITIGSRDTDPLKIYKGFVKERSYNGPLNVEVVGVSFQPSHGSSGAPVFDSSGRVVGITYTSTNSARGIFWFIPIEYATFVYNTHKTSLELSDYLKTENPDMWNIYYAESVSMNDLNRDRFQYRNKVIRMDGYISFPFAKYGERDSIYLIEYYSDFDFLTNYTPRIADPGITNFSAEQLFRNYNTIHVIDNSSLFLNYKEGDRVEVCGIFHAYDYTDSFDVYGGFIEAQQVQLKK